MLDIPSEDWVWRDKGDLLKYGMTSSGDGVKFLCDKNLFPLYEANLATSNFIDQLIADTLGGKT
jgi:hypothetical protein